MNIFITLSNNQNEVIQKARLRSKNILHLGHQPLHQILDNLSSDFNIEQNRLKMPK